MEEKRERFKKVAESRTNKIIDMLKLLGNCGNIHNYEYTDEEVKKIFDAIDSTLRETKKCFKSNQNHSKKFEL